MANFLDTRRVVKAEELRGPRIYSTDLLPSHFNPEQPEESVELAARALKVKMITKGIVTLNSAYLVSPLGVLLMDKHPDLFSGEAIVPAFRTDKESLADLIASNEGLSEAGITDRRLDDHIARLDSSIVSAMPWALADVGEKFRTLLLAGLRQGNSHVVAMLRAAGLSGEDVEKVAEEVAALDLSNSVTLRSYIGGLPAAARDSMLQFAATCYHLVGTGVVRCEAGTDLHPLSAFRAVDGMLAGRDSSAEQLSETAIFIEAFMGFALDSIHAMAAPSQIIDSLDFATVHKLGDALRETGFQDKYDGIIRDYRNAAALPDGEEALHALDAEGIAEVAAGLAREFEDHVLTELIAYHPRIVETAKATLIETRNDIIKDIGQATPGLGTVISVAEATRDAARLGTAYKEVRELRDKNAAFAAAKVRRRENIEAAIKTLKADDTKKAVLLKAVALLSDIHGIRIQRS